MGAAGEQRIAMALRQVREDLAQRRNILGDDVEAGADLQHYGCVHDILGGGAPMHVAAGLAAHLHELVDEWQDRIADDVGLVTKVIEVELVDIRIRGDLTRGFGGDHAAFGLRLRERHFDFDVAGD